VACNPSYLNRRLFTAGIIGAALLPKAAVSAETTSKNLSLKNLTFEDFGKVARVIDGDSLICESGLRVKLANILAPDGAPKQTQRFAKQSSQALEAFVSGRQIGLYYEGPTRDRYDRAMAQVFTLRPDGTADQWLQQELIELGAARVRSYAKSAWQTDVLLKAESVAREAGRGLCR